MPPLEMSDKAIQTPFPPHPTMKVVPKMERLDRPPLCFPPRNCTTWSQQSYFSFTNPKPNTSTVNAPTRREVKFVSCVTVHHVLHLTEYSKEEVINTWYSKREIRAMKQKCKEEATQVVLHAFENEDMRIHDEHGPLVDSTNKYVEPTSTLRGLESKTTMGSLRKKRHRIQAWTAVFMEQRRQNIEGLSDPESLADAYFEVSEPCHVVANMVAIRDARDVESIEEWETKIELEKENQRGIITSETSGEMHNHARRYQRLMALHNRSQRQLPVMIVSAA